mmetsp:Transcript_22319/g.34536  ORF Transcript_22319/g.34536 Transcript_22319/m.34536 type:complete len:124 (+) Transcript_22319:1917-2288(+)
MTSEQRKEEELRKKRIEDEQKELEEPMEQLYVEGGEQEQYEGGGEGGDEGGQDEMRSARSGKPLLQNKLISSKEKPPNKSMSSALLNRFNLKVNNVPSSRKNTELPSMSGAPPSGPIEVEKAS